MSSSSSSPGAATSATTSSKRYSTHHLLTTSPQTRSSEEQAADGGEGNESNTSPSPTSSPSRPDTNYSQSTSTSSHPSIPSATSLPWRLSTFPASSFSSSPSYHGFQAHFSFVTRKMDIVIDRDFMLSLLCTRYHLQVRDVLIKKYKVNEARRCQSGYGFLFIDRLEDTEIVIKNLQGLCLEGIEFDCKLSNRSLEKINAVRRAAGFDGEGRREGEAEQRGSRGPEDSSSLPPSTTPSGCSLSNSRRDLSSFSTSTIYASTSSEEYSSYDSHDSHSRFIENRSYGTVAAPTMSLRHLEGETVGPARCHSSSSATVSYFSAPSQQSAIPYYHGPLPRYEAAGPSTASTMISASSPTLPSNGMRPNLLRVGTVAPTPASQQMMMMMMPQIMAANDLQGQGMVIFPPSYGNNHSMYYAWPSQPSPLHPSPCYAYHPYYYPPPPSFPSTAANLPNSSISSHNIT